MSSIIPRDILIKEGEFTLMGLKITHNGRGRVIIRDERNSGKLYSDSDYYSPEQVEGIINNIFEVKYARS